MVRCRWCKLLYEPAQLKQHERDCLDNPDNEGNG